MSLVSSPSPVVRPAEDWLEVDRVLLVLRQRWRFLVVATLVGLLSALLTARFLLTPVYQVTVRILVESGLPGQPGPLPTGGGASAPLYAQIAAGEELKRAVAQRLGLLPAEVAPAALPDLPFRVRARALSGTPIVEIQVESADRTLAFRAAETLTAVLVEGTRQRQAQRFAAVRERLEEQIASLQAEVATLRARPGLTPTETEQLTRLQTALAQLQASEATLRLAEAQMTDLLTVLEPARLPLRPAWPSLPVAAGLGAVLGLALGGVGIILADQLDRRLRTPEAAEQVLGLPVLATLVRVADPATPPWDLTGPNGEAFRLLRTNLRFASGGRPVPVLTVTSSQAEEGKSTVVLGLAGALALLGQRVVVVDADLRRPVLHRVLAQPRAPGLADCLANPDLDPVALLQAVPVAGPGSLQVLLAGTPPPNPGELLASARLEAVLTRLQTGADQVLVDSPPVAAGADALLLASRSAGVLVVVDAGATDRRWAQGVVRQLRERQVPLLGLVVNNLTAGPADYYYYYRSYTDGRASPRPDGRGLLGWVRQLRRR